MQHKTLIFILYAVIIPLLCSCNGNATRTTATEHGDTLQMHHSSLLQIIEYKGYSIANVKNPWKKGSLLHQYLLLHKDSTADINPHEGATLLHTPLDKQLLFATLHAELFTMLGCEEAISGVCDAQYMSVPAVQQGIANGKIIDCGNSMDINLEQLIELSPKAAWVIPFKNGGYGKMERTGIPLIECVDYMENSPLGAAEWMRFYGRLLGVAEKADSLFDIVCDNYEETKSMIANCSRRPKLICELKSGAAWYMPGGNSTMGQLYRDAGADYLFGNNDERGGVPLSFETVLERGENADIWLFKYNTHENKSYLILEKEFENYKLLRPFRERNIYACNTGRRRFYEETPFRPDILLRELSMLFHPELSDGYTFRYYEKLQE